MTPDTPKPPAPAPASAETHRNDGPAWMRRAQAAEAEVEAAWAMLQQCYDIEPREVITRESKANGFEYPLAQAVFTIHKRAPKANQAPASERLALLLKTAIWSCEGDYEEVTRILADALRRLRSTSTVVGDERAASLIAQFEATIAECKADLGEDYGKPNSIDEDGTERCVPCEHCTERAAAVEVIRGLQRRLQSTEQEQFNGDHWFAEAQQQAQRAESTELELALLKTNRVLPLSVCAYCGETVPHVRELEQAHIRECQAMPERELQAKLETLEQRATDAERARIVKILTELKVNAGSYAPGEGSGYEMACDDALEALTGDLEQKKGT